MRGGGGETTSEHEGSDFDFRLRPHAATISQARHDLGVSARRFPKVRSAHLLRRQKRLDFVEQIIRHGANLSSKEDMSSIHYRGRADLSEIEDIPAMLDDGWKDRLAAGIKKNKRSKRGVSIEAGQGPGYVHSILKEGKDPTVSNLAAVCDAAGLSIYYVLGGFDITPEREEFLRALLEAEKEDVEAVARLLGAGRKRAKIQEPPAE